MGRDTMERGLGPCRTSLRGGDEDSGVGTSELVLEDGAVELATDATAEADAELGQDLTAIGAVFDAGEGNTDLGSVVHQ